MIPNICHFVFGLKEQECEFLFCYYISVYSAYYINTPDEINFYYHFTPFGPWWDELVKIPRVKLVKIEVPTHIGNKALIKTAHKADKVRMDVLYNKGGIYLDIDTICVRPWKELLHERVVLGKELHNTRYVGICNAIMFTEPNSEFFKIWIHNYEQVFRSNGWNEASVFLPKAISDKKPELLTLKESDVFFLPNCQEVSKIFEYEMNIPINLVSLHLWETASLKYLSLINGWDWAHKNSHTMYGKMLLNLSK